MIVDTNDKNYTDTDLMLEIGPKTFSSALNTTHGSEDFRLTVFELSRVDLTKCEKIWDGSRLSDEEAPKGMFLKYPQEDDEPKYVERRWLDWERLKAVLEGPAQWWGSWWSG